MRPVIIAFISVLIVSCDEEERAPAVMVVPTVPAAQTSPEAVAPQPARGAVDPTVRFASAGGSMDREPFTRPAPWLSETPRIDALVPTAPAAELSESWKVVDVGGEALVEHRVHGIFRVAPRSELARIGAELDLLRLTPRSDIRPVATIEASVEPPEPGIPRITAWADDELGMPVHVVAEPYGTSAVQVSIAVLHPSAERDATLGAFAAAVPRFAEVERALRGLGVFSAAEYSRTAGRAPISTWTVERSPTPEEERALEASSQDDGAAFLRASASADRRWNAQVATAMRALRLTRESRADQFPAWRRGDVQGLVVASSCTILVGETAPPSP